MSYIGNEPIVSATRTITEITATAGQTVFTANGGYTVGYIDVFLNGAQLQTVDFTATNGSSITLTEAAQAGDVIRLVAWGTFSTSNLVSPNYTGTLTGGTGVVNIGSGQVYKDASGNVGIGTSSPNALVTIEGSSATTSLSALSITNTESGAGVVLTGTGTTFSNTGWLTVPDAAYIRGAGAASGGMVIHAPAGPLIFGAGNSTSERMRIDSSGRLIVGGTTASGAITGDAGSTSSGTGLASRGGGAGSTGGQIGMMNTYAGVPNPSKSLRVNNNGDFEIVNSAYSAIIFSLTNGGAAYNTTGTWGTISDERVKENIQDSRGYLDDLCKLRVVKYSLKSEESQIPTKLGFIAQEVEQVFPSMIEESLDTFGDLDKIKQVKMSILTPMLVKALQEQQAIITDLKQRIETLESK